MSIVVNYATITHAAQEVEKTAGKIQAQLDAIEAKVKAVAETWEGEARENYQRKQKEWDTTAKDLHQTLLKISKALHNSADSYRSTERANANVWNT